MTGLSRDTDERKALVRGLINALIRNESIETTEAKANAIRKTIEQLVTKAKKADLHNRRQIESFLIDVELTGKLTQVLAPRMEKRAGGYTRTIKIGRRKGDNAMIVRIEFCDKNGKNDVLKPEEVNARELPQNTDASSEVQTKKKVTKKVKKENK